MIRFIISTAISLATLSTYAQDGFLIQGKLSGNHEGKIVRLIYPNPAGLKDPIQDSTFVKNGTFAFQGKSDKDLTRAKIVMSIVGQEIDPSDYTRYYEIDQQHFILENSKFNVTGKNLQQAKIIGGEAQADYNKLSAQLKPLEDQMKPLSQKMIQYGREKNENAREELYPKVRKIAQEKSKVMEAFVINNPDSYVSLQILNEGGGTDDASLASQFDALSDKVKSTDLGRETAARLKATQTVEVGNPAVDFSMSDTEGNPVALSSLRGKYVFLDFWASWCGPCRSENPNLIKAYDNLKGDNFEIIAVSLDNKKEHWLKAIKDDNLPWIHVSDLKGTKNEAALKYGVTGIPQNFLISPEGIILGIGFRGEDILEKLREHMKEK